jgi:hypothetical protein
LAAVPQERSTILKAGVVALYHNPESIKEIMLAETEFWIPPDCFLVEPRVRIMVETTAGRELHDAATMNGLNDLRWDVRPGGLNRQTYTLPAHTVRFRLILTGREAGLRVRWFQGLNSCDTWWAREGSGRLRPIWSWLGRRLPNTPGRRVRFESAYLPDGHERTLEVVHNHPAPGKAGITSLLTIEHHRSGLPDPTSEVVQATLFLVF